jgi:hypothetical protein
MSRAPSLPPTLASHRPGLATAMEALVAIHGGIQFRHGTVGRSAMWIHGFLARRRKRRVVRRHLRPARGWVDPRRRNLEPLAVPCGPQMAWRKEDPA